MKLIDEIFYSYQLKEEALIPYGFSFENGKYLLNKLIHNNEFEMKVVIKDKKISAKLIDTNFGDEFNQIDMDVTGSFVASLKEECLVIFLDIRDKCFEKVYFNDTQAVRITKYIFDKYGDSPEFLWPEYPTYGVFRNKGNNKWYGIIMDVKENKLAQGVSARHVINVKVDPDRYDELLKVEGIYKGWHMNKKSWISISLSEYLKDEVVESLIDMSYKMIKKGK